MCSLHAGIGVQYICVMNMDSACSGSDKCAVLSSSAFSDENVQPPDPPQSVRTGDGLVEENEKSEFKRPHCA